MIPQVQHSQNFDIAAAPMQVEEEGEFQWTQATKSIFKSACLALIYLNGGKIELKKERVSHGNATCAIYPKAIKHIIDRGNFPGVRTLSTKVLGARCYMLRQKSKNSGLIWEQELLKQYQTLQTTNRVNDHGEKIPALLEELNKFGIGPEEYNQGVPIENYFKWDEEREAIFKSACFAIIYLNGGTLELAKERVASPSQKSVISYAIVEHMLEKGNFPEFKTLPKYAVKDHIHQLKEKSRKNGTIWEEELLKQYQEREAKTIANAEGKEISAIYNDLDKFGIKPEEYDQWFPIKKCFKWDEEREKIFASACVALIYLNGGEVELKKERVANGKQKSIFSPQAVEYILQKGNIPVFKNLPQRVLNNHLLILRANSKKRGLTLEEELLKQYQELEAKTIVNDKGESTTLLLEELNKFGVQPAEYDQWFSIKNCFHWDEKREEIFNSACLTLLYLNGGLLELSEERITDKRVKIALSTQPIEYLLKKGNFPEFKNLSKMAIQNHLKWLKNMAQKNESSWEEEILNQYQELEQVTVFNEIGEEIPAIWKELDKFGIKPDDYDSWQVMQPKTSSKRQKSRKRPAEEPAEPEAEPQEKRANNALEKPPQRNRVTHWKKRLVSAWEEINQHNYF